MRACDVSQASAKVYSNIYIWSTDERQLAHRIQPQDLLPHSLILLVELIILFRLIFCDSLFAQETGSSRWPAQEVNYFDQIKPEQIVESLNIYWKTTNWETVFPSYLIT